MLEENLKKLAEELELPPFSPKDKESYYHLSLTDDLTFSIKSLKPGFFLFANVAPLPSQKKEEAFIYFMKGNLLGQGTGDQVLGIDEEENFLTLSRQISYDMNYKDFKDILEDFANYLDYWRRETEKLQKEADASIM